ncbi:serine acetyltransferase [Vibrio owensii]|uniref:serine O-acetyltransferase n=1 Tax=Vibrio owensii TaxID=696485 RepID=UPI002F426E97
MIIKTKKELKYFLHADKFALGKTYSFPRIYDKVWLFQIYLRYYEYFANNGSVFKYIFQYLKFRLGIKLGFDIPINVFGPGLRINHFGNIVIHNKVRIGAWCDIHQGVNIGSNLSSSGEPLVPVIGSNVWIGPGAKIFGDILIGNSVVVGTNSVVFKDVKKSSLIVGNPGVVVRNSGTECLHVMANIRTSNDFYDKYPQYAEFNK